MTKKELLSMSNYNLDKTVKIQGTKFDRKRKVSAKTIAKINYLKACGKTYCEIAKMLELNPITVRYHFDENYKYKMCHVGGTHAHGNLDLDNRASYKRSLVSANAHVIYPMD
jgi:hypothetical protein